MNITFRKPFMGGYQRFQSNANSQHLSAGPRSLTGGFFAVPQACTKAMTKGAKLLASGKSRELVNECKWQELIRWTNDLIPGKFGDLQTSNWNDNSREETLLNISVVELFNNIASRTFCCSCVGCVCSCKYTCAKRIFETHSTGNTSETSYCGDAVSWGSCYRNQQIIS